MHALAFPIGSLGVAAEKTWEHHLFVVQYLLSFHKLNRIRIRNVGSIADISEVLDRRFVASASAINSMVTVRNFIRHS